MTRNRIAYCPICRDERRFDDTGYCERCENNPEDFIVQMIPMPGWQAVYADENHDGTVSLLTEHLLGLAVTASGSLRVVVGDGTGEVFADELGNYLGPLAPGEDIERFRAEAERQVKRSGTKG